MTKSKYVVMLQSKILFPSELPISTAFLLNFHIFPIKFSIEYIRSTVFVSFNE